ncbi:thiamine permease [Mangrovactinospora gilvigrisea]|uniref:Thiamine permease n=1 Tax=Mangrovactinospora gilvigrisea TaxID=1428644 RepID=A0A1J7CH16_9ACTN|nr:cytosine permease [Mangrovactinospora gilvigrisea]OIV38930.1 thiamine permease [Mangrovactinospora gilvigrisea]
MSANTSPAAIETNGINTVPDAERHGRPAGLFWPWAASNLSLAGIAFGVYIVGLGLSAWQALTAGAVGYLLSFLLVGAVSVAGPRTGAPTMAVSRLPFGRQGNKLPTAFSYLSNVGWETVLVTLSAMGGAAILARTAPSAFATHGSGSAPTTAATALCFAVTALSVVLVGMFGHALIMRVQAWLTVVIAVFTVAYLVIMIPKLDLGRLGSLHGGGPAAFLGGIVLAMTLLGLGWVNCGADYSRYLPRRTAAGPIAGWTTFGGVLAPLVLLVFGVLMTAGDPKLAAAASADPVGALAERLPTWFLVPYLLTAIGGFVSGAIMDIYSSGMSMLALGVPIRRHLAVLVDGVLMTAGGFYLLFVSDSFFATFQAFLSIIGVAMAAWCAVFLVDVWRFRGRDGESWPPPELARRVGWPAVAAMVAATAVGLGLITSTDENLAHAVGYLLTPGAKSGTWGAANLGVVAALPLAAALYAVLLKATHRR